MNLRRGRRRSDADAYAAAVGRQLRDLRRPERRRLVADLRQHLAELPTADDLAATLGSPKLYAAELRSSNGIAPPHGMARLRRVRPAWWIGGGLAVVVVVFAVVAGVWLLRYQPLELGMTSSIPGIQADDVFGDNTSVVVDYQDSAQYEFEMSVMNDGPLDVEITDIPLRNFVTSPLLVDEVRLDPPNEYVAGDEAPLFHPFTLHAQEDRGLVFRGVLTHCDLLPDGGTSTLGSFDIRYRVFGIEKTQTIDLRKPIAIHMPRTTPPACPLPRPPQEGVSNGVGTDTLSVLHSGGSVQLQAVSPTAGTGELIHASWAMPSRCTAAAIPDGQRAVPLDIVLYEFPATGDYRVPSALPIDLRFGFAGNTNNVLLAPTGSTAPCRAGGPLHIDSIGDGDIAVGPGVLLLPLGTCGPQPLDVNVADNGTERSIGPVLLDIPCKHPPGT